MNAKCSSTEVDGPVPASRKWPSSGATFEPNHHVDGLLITGSGTPRRGAHAFPLRPAICLGVRLLSGNRQSMCNDPPQQFLNACAHDTTTPCHVHDPQPSLNAPSICYAMPHSGRCSHHPPRTHGAIPTPIIQPYPAHVRMKPQRRTHVHRSPNHFSFTISHFSCMCT